MNDLSCIFCKIIKGEIPSKKIKETDQVLVIEDRAPKAPIHYLIIPKIHVVNLKEIQEKDKECLWATLMMAKELSGTIENASAFNLLSNNGAAAGQSVFHLHWHFVAGAGPHRF